MAFVMSSVSALSILTDLAQIRTLMEMGRPSGLMIKAQVLEHSSVLLRIIYFPSCRSL
jgi:hypothetical protein